MTKKSSIAPTKNQAITPEQYGQLFDKAQAQLARRDTAGVLDTCKRILGRLPKKARARGDILHLMGLAYSLQEQFELSYMILTEALKFNPDEAMLWYNRGLSARFTFRLGQSLRDFERAAQLDQAGQFKDKLDDALTFGRQLVEQSLRLRGPGFTVEKLIEQETLFQNGLNMMRVQMWREAELNFRQEIALADVLPQPQGNLGICLMMQHRLDEAETALKRALEIDGEYELARQNLSMLAEVRRTGRLPAGLAINEPMAGQGAKTTVTMIKQKGSHG
jgi:tetratricopeptide (TPR) repeat protein